MKVIAIIPVFNPTIELSQNLIEIIAQVDEVAIVDNGSSIDTSTLANNLLATHENLIWFKQDNNLGIASALNVGFEYAKSKNFDYILTLDQDSEIPIGYVDDLLSIFLDSAISTNIGIVVPDIISGSNSIPFRFTPEGYGLVEEAIQSGMLIKADCLKVLKGMDEKLFIDCVDTDFCLRAIDAGFKIVISKGAEIQHRLGENIRPNNRLLQQLFGWGNVSHFQYHKPFRQYYIVRNNIDLCLRNFFKRPRWVASVIRRELKPRVLDIFWGPEKSKSFVASLLGAIHGFTRRRGKIPDYLSKKL